MRKASPWTHLPHHCSMPLPNIITYNTEKVSRHSCVEKKAQEHTEDLSAVILMPQMLSAQAMNKKGT